MNKGSLDPFQPEKADDIERLKTLQRDVHDVFIGLVKDRRAGKLKGPDSELFSGAFWSSGRALEYGLIDGISDVRTKMQELFGDEVRLRAIPVGKTGLLSRLRRPLGVAAVTGGGLSLPEFSIGDDLISAIEARALWSRFGL